MLEQGINGYKFGLPSFQVTVETVV